ADEARPGAFVRATAILRVAHLLSISHSSERFRRNPVQEVHLPKMEKKLPLVLTRQQVEELLTAPAREQKSRSAPSWMPLRDVAIMELFYSSGLRLSELAALDIADVDPYTESVRVFGKGRKERVC